MFVDSRYIVVLVDVTDLRSTFGDSRRIVVVVDVTDSLSMVVGNCCKVVFVGVTGVFYRATVWTTCCASDNRHARLLLVELHLSFQGSATVALPSLLATFALLPIWATFAIVLFWRHSPSCFLLASFVLLPLFGDIRPRAYSGVIRHSVAFAYH